MFVTEAVGRALKETLGDVRPAATMIVGARFVDKDMKVEIEADAVVLSTAWMTSFIRFRNYRALHKRWYNCVGDIEYKYNQVLYAHKDRPPYIR